MYALIYIQAYLGGTVGSFQPTSIKQILQQSESSEFLGFPVHLKVVFTLYHSLLSMQ